MKATMKLPPIDIPPIDDIIKEHKLPNGFQNKVGELPLYILVSSADNLCK